jgi:peptidoglycan/LPS O-acetylase OafA/YrhL
MYRKDIEGLRAVAVVLVVLFHLEITIFSGGFVGVDVFFVISGYLITRMIWSGKHEFNARSFYIRRLYRLFPALAVTIVATTCASWFILLPSDMLSTLKSALLALSSVSNIGFWLESGYWDADSKLKPLLHTWSLGVEAQFYLVWPLLLLFAKRHRWSNQFTGFIVLTIAVIGVFASEWAVRKSPSSAFYLSPFRITEFALGASLIFFEHQIGRWCRKWVAELLFLSGLVGIFSTALLFNESTPFPGFFSWLPCVATIAVISAHQVKYLKVILSNPVCELVGRISYCIYLIHWPIIVLTHYKLGENFSFQAKVILLLVITAAALLLYSFVERPLRIARGNLRSYNFTRGAFRFIGVLFILTFSLTLFTLNLNAQGGKNSAQVSSIPTEQEMPSSKELLNVLDPNALRLEIVRETCPELEDEACLILSKIRPNVLVLGDSLGVDGFIATKTALPNANVIPAGKRGCVPVADINAYYKRVGIYTSQALADECVAWNTNLFAEDGVVKGVDIIVGSMFWRPTRLMFFEGTLKRIRQLNPNAPILLLGNGTILNRRFIDIARNIDMNRGVTIPQDELYPMTFSMDETLASLASRHEGVNWSSKNAFFCPGKRCAVYTPSGRDFVLYDRLHLSATASQEFGLAVVRPWLQRFISENETLAKRKSST